MEDDIVKVDVKKKSLLGVNIKKPQLKKQMLWVALSLVLLISVISAGYFYKKYSDLKKDPKSAQVEKNKAETARVLDKVKLAILVTETEAPTVARVEDPDKLKTSNQEFYKNIQKGDYLVIFPKRAIVFRESNNQIINIAPIINTSDLKKPEGTTPANSQQKTTTQPTTNTKTR